MNTRIYINRLQQNLLDLSETDEVRAEFYIAKIKELISDIEVELEEE